MMARGAAIWASIACLSVQLASSYAGAEDRQIAIDSGDTGILQPVLDDEAGPNLKSRLVRSELFPHLGLSRHADEAFLDDHSLGRSGDSWIELDAEQDPVPVTTTATTTASTATSTSTTISTTTTASSTTVLPVAHLGNAVVSISYTGQNVSSTKEAAERDSLEAALYLGFGILCGLVLICCGGALGWVYRNKCSSSPDSAAFLAPEKSTDEGQASHAPTGNDDAAPSAAAPGAATAPAAQSVAATNAKAVPAAQTLEQAATTQPMQHGGFAVQGHATERAVGPAAETPAASSWTSWAPWGAATAAPLASPPPIQAAAPMVLPPMNAPPQPGPFTAAVGSIPGPSGSMFGFGQPAAPAMLVGQAPVHSSIPTSSQAGFAAAAQPSAPANIRPTSAAQAHTAPPVATTPQPTAAASFMAPAAPSPPQVEEDDHSDHSHHDDDAPQMF